MGLNPWQAKSLEDFTFICCPECIYKSKDADSFQNHALDNHPNSKDFFRIKQEQIEDPLESEFIPNLELTYADDIKPDENYEEENQEEFDLPEKSERKVTQCLVCLKDCETIFKKQYHVRKEHPIITCAECHEEFTNYTKLSQHFSRKHQPKTSFQCDQCWKFFHSKQYLKRHINTVHSSLDEIKETVKENVFEDIKDLSTKKSDEKQDLYRNLTQCLVCLKDCESIIGKRDHIIEEHPMITCAKCDEVFPNHSKLANHFHRRHRPVECDQCGKIVTSKHGLKRHLETVHVDREEKNFQCDECPFRTFAKYNLKTHKLYVHKLKRKSNQNLNIPKELIDKNGDLICPECSLKVRAAGYVTHFKKIHKCLPPHIDNSKKKVCEFCTEEFQLGYNLKLHIQNKHSDKLGQNEDSEIKVKKSQRNRKPPTKQEMTCKLCNIVYKAKSGYVLHYKNIHKTLPPEYESSSTVFCDQCGKIFSDSNRLNVHIKYVHNKEPKRDLPKIVKIKECSYCSKTFRNPQNWEEHVKVIHEEIYNFKCEDCGRKFYAAGKYKDHRITIHTKAPCDICGKGQFNKYDLSKHKLRTHDIKPEAEFECDKCQTYFQCEKKLIYHKSKVHKE